MYSKVNINVVYEESDMIICYRVALLKFFSSHPMHDDLNLT